MLLDERQQHQDKVTMAEHLVEILQMLMNIQEPVAVVVPVVPVVPVYFIILIEDSKD